MKTHYWILILAIAAIAGTLLSVFLLSRQHIGGVAGVYSDGELVCTVNVGDPGEFREFTISHSGGVNVVVVDQNGIMIESASCPDGVCIMQGYLGAAPIVCLPNRLLIKWLDGYENPYDAVAG